MKALEQLESALAVSTALGEHRDALMTSLARSLDALQHGDAVAWETALDNLPVLRATSIDLASPSIRIGTPADIDAMSQRSLRDALQALHPWRKGPFTLFGIDIDSEWRSDWKWQRLQPHIASLADRCVLDVGCGNGYYALRMLGQGARFVLGIDPSLRLLMQFQAIQHYLADPRVLLLPLRGEDLPARLGCFDTVFSMGVLYHRRAPLDHLAELHGALRPGGELVLESLVVDGNAEHVLMPADRYARMRNVWFIPSCDALLRWLQRSGFRDARVVDVTPTRPGEQRRTAWMRFESLEDCLDRNDPGRTVEGYPAPLRAIILANK